MTETPKSKKTARIDEFKSAVLFAKAQKLQSFKFGEFEGQFHPMALIDQIASKEPYIPAEEIERRRKKEEDDILFHSA